jgi:hypothetical protein
LVGAKTDLFYERTVDTTYLTSFLEKYGLAEIVETSARNNHNLEALFELATVIAMYHKELISKRDFILFNENIKKRIQEPVPEPYEKLIRKCYKCGRTLLFHEFYDSNNKNFSEDRLFKLWESPYLQFYCCTCYKDLSYNQNRN